MSSLANKKSYVIRTPTGDHDVFLNCGVSLVSSLGGWTDALTGERAYIWHIDCNEPTLTMVLLKTGGTLKREY